MGEGGGPGGIELWLGFGGGGDEEFVVLAVVPGIAAGGAGEGRIIHVPADFAGFGEAG